MAQAPSRVAVSWVYFNVAMFSAYALFGSISLFWPSALNRPWLYPLHLGGLAFNFAVIYGLLRKRPWTSLLIVLYAVGMIAHLVVFILVPLSMVIAYVGPSRSFYTLMIMALPLLDAKEHSVLVASAFNAVMVLVHAINIWFFLGPYRQGRPGSPTPP